MTNKEAIQILRCSGYTSNPIEIDEAIELACKALEEREDLIERAYGHIVGQGTQGVIRPDNLQGWRYEQ